MTSNANSPAEAAFNYHRRDFSRENTSRCQDVTFAQVFTQRAHVQPGSARFWSHEKKLSSSGSNHWCTSYQTQNLHIHLDKVQCLLQHTVSTVCAYINTHTHTGLTVRLGREPWGCDQHDGDWTSTDLSASIFQPPAAEDESGARSLDIAPLHCSYLAARE